MSAAPGSEATEPLQGQAVERRLLAALTDRGLIDAAAAQRAERARAQTGERLERVLTRLGLVSERDMAGVLAACLELAVLAPADLPAAPLAEDQLPAAYLREHGVLPIRMTNDVVRLAMADPLAQDIADAVGYLLDRRVERVVAVPAELEAAIERLYGSDADAQAAAVPGSMVEAGADDDVERLRDIASEAPIIRLVQQLIARAVEIGASDIHIEPTEDALRVRYRIDGVLHTVETLPPGARAAVTSRVKIMARLDIAERRLPQDGRIKTAVRGRDVDLRVSTMPTLHGESVVLRILDRTAVRLDFAALGFEGEVLERFRRALTEPNGIVLVTGPTGSGKTTTLYAALAMLNNAAQKLFTVEDPIEYQLEGINQIQVQPKIGLSFAHALRSILRQDPDIVMVGEIRDLETAQVAIQASLTGHLVLSSVHTNSAAATVVRLIDMGIEDYLLASSLTAVLAQRLVRRLCPHCAIDHDGTPGALRRILADAWPERAGSGIEAMVAHDAHRLRRAVGCARCRNTGYVGRTAVMELLLVDDAMRELIAARAGERRLEAAAIAAGMTTMYRHGLTKALAGETTIEEVLHATRIR